MVRPYFAYNRNLPNLLNNKFDWSLDLLKRYGVNFYTATYADLKINHYYDITILDKSSGRVIYSWYFYKALFTLQNFEKIVHITCSNKPSNKKITMHINKNNPQIKYKSRWHTTAAMSKDLKGSYKRGQAKRVNEEFTIIKKEVSLRDYFKRLDKRKKARNRKRISRFLAKNSLNKSSNNSFDNPFCPFSNKRRLSSNTGLYNKYSNN